MIPKTCQPKQVLYTSTVRIVAGVKRSTQRRRNIILVFIPVAVRSISRPSALHFYLLKQKVSSV